MLSTCTRTPLPAGPPAVRAAAPPAAGPPPQRPAAARALGLHMAARADARRGQLYARVHLERWVAWGTLPAEPEQAGVRLRAIQRAEACCRGWAAVRLWRLLCAAQTMRACVLAQGTRLDGSSISGLSGHALPCSSWPCQPWPLALHSQRPSLAGPLACRAQGDGHAPHWHATASGVLAVPCTLHRPQGLGRATPSRLNPHAPSPPPHGPSYSPLQPSTLVAPPARPCVRVLCPHLGARAVCCARRRRALGGPGLVARPPQRLHARAVPVLRLPGCPQLAL